MRKYAPTLAALAFSLAAGAPLHAQQMDSLRGRWTDDVTAQDHCRQRRQLADHTTLVAAVKAAGLVEKHPQGTGPFTVFAPTNEAFAALPAGTVDNLVKPENKPTLVKILTYHVIAGDYTVAKLMTRSTRVVAA